MSVEQRIAQEALEADAGFTSRHPQTLHESRGVFTPGHRIRMNVVPMFLNVFIPWGIFIFVLGVTSFYVMYSKPLTGYLMVGVAVLFWLATVFFAINRRKYDPDPSWFTFFSGMVGLAIVFGAILGCNIYSNFSFPYYQVSDLKVASNLDVSTERGQNVMDAGMFYFAQGNTIDARRAWHFKQKTVYCVAPITKADSPIPQSQSFDFWAVGKDCCSVSASDFRCGDYSNPLARGGIRNMRNEDRAFYRLAVEQASALYGIQATNPIFFEWSADPRAAVESWNSRGFQRFMAYASFAFIVSAFAVSMASCKFSFLGRAESVYGEEIFDDPNWKKGASGGNYGFNQPLDLHTHMRRV